MLFLQLLSERHLFIAYAAFSSLLLWSCCALSFAAVMLMLWLTLSTYNVSVVLKFNNYLCTWTFNRVILYRVLVLIPSTLSGFFLLPYTVVSLLSFPFLPSFFLLYSVMVISTFIECCTTHYSCNSSHSAAVVYLCCSLISIEFP